MKHDVELLACTGVPADRSCESVRWNAIRVILGTLDDVAARARMLDEPNRAIADSQSDPADEITLIFVEGDMRLPLKNPQTVALCLRRGA